MDGTIDTWQNLIIAKDSGRAYVFFKFPIQRVNSLEIY